MITCNRIPLSPATQLRCVVANLKLCGGNALIRGDIAKLRDYVDEFAGGEMVFFSHQTVWDGEGSHEPEGVERSGARRAESKPLGVAFLQ